MIRANSRMSSPWLLSSRLDCVTHNSMMLCSRKMRSDRKSTRLNSSHLGISYAVFCLKKKNVGHTEPLLISIARLDHAQHHNLRFGAPRAFRRPVQRAVAYFGVIDEQQICSLVAGLVA